jgi:hypothetical protein
MSYGGLHLGDWWEMVFSAAADSRGQEGRKHRLAVIRLIDSCNARFQEGLRSEFQRLNHGQVQVVFPPDPVFVVEPIADKSD